MKRCSKCKRKRSVGEFYKDKSKGDGLHVWCKDCMIEYDRQHRQTHKVEIAKRGKEYRQTHKIKAAEYHQKYQQSLKGYLRHCFGGIKQRCNNPNNPRYKDYGDRGIKCLFETANDFICYIIDVLGFNTIEKLKGLQIDRIENDGHYEPGNIRFVTAKVNMNNRRQ